MIPLNNVTIISINGRDPENSVKALNYSSRRIKFAKKILVTTSDKAQKYDDIEVFEYDIKNRDVYSYFCIKELYKYIDTDFCLIVQPDGFVINPLAWNEKFLDFDYIGAPFVPKAMAYALAAFNKLNPGENFTNLKHSVGNGGFSLRSKKFLIESSKLDYPPKENIADPYNANLEDFFLCVGKRKDLENVGIKFATVYIASMFSIEFGLILDKLNVIRDHNFTHNSWSAFGFHGVSPRHIKDPLLAILDNPDLEKNLNIYENLKHFIKL